MTTVLRAWKRRTRWVDGGKWVVPLEGNGAASAEDPCNSYEWDSAIKLLSLTDSYQSCNAGWIFPSGCFPKAVWVNVFQIGLLRSLCMTTNLSGSMVLYLMLKADWILRFHLMTLVRPRLFSSGPLLCNTAYVQLGSEVSGQWPSFHLFASIRAPPRIWIKTPRCDWGADLHI